MTIHKSGDGTTVYGEDVVSSSGSWDVQLLKPFPTSTFRVACRQTLNGFASHWGDPGHTWNVTFPTIASPPPGAVIPTGSGSFFKGIAATGWMVKVVNAANRNEVLGSAVVVGSNRSWECPLIPTLASRTVTVEAQYSRTTPYPGVVYSAPLTCTILGAPTINAPSNIVDTTFNLTGGNGVQGATVEIFIDLSQTKVGQAGVFNPPGWNGSVTVPPGAVTLVARQNAQGVLSSLGAPVIFRVRPPRLTSITVTPLDNAGLRFSGTGYGGAIVKVIKVSGPGSSTVPPVTVGSTGTWSVDAANWPPGQYSFKATQTVLDNTGGEIVSTDFVFNYTLALPVPTARHTGDYRPVFSGGGYTGATVVLVNPGGGSKVAPDAWVSGGSWSSTASEVWGPTFKRKVQLRQEQSGHTSSGWVELEVTIAPLAPVITEITGGDDSQRSPTVKGTCWPGAVVKLVFSDAPTSVHEFPVPDGNWTYRRPTPFTPNVPHTVTVTQTVAQQTSSPTTRTFEVRRTLFKPVITEPTNEAEVERDLTVRGRQGVTGASMQLRIDGINAGAPKQLTSDGDWSIDLKGLAFGRLILDARQTLDGRPSELSESVPFNVVLMPPKFTTPVPGGDLPRRSTIYGTGMPGALVEVWLEGRDEPLLRSIPVNTDGRWEGPVALSVGVTKLLAKQAIGQVDSKLSPPLTCNVVPTAPNIETPVKDGHIGSSTVVSGFGEPGDRVSIYLGDTLLGSAAVLEDRTWSVPVTLTQPGGAYVLVAVASFEGFESDRSAQQPVVLGRYLPTIDSPLAGSWVSHPVIFSGQGRLGTGQLVSWFNPETSWVPDQPVNAQGWRGVSGRELPVGGNWCRFQQTIMDGADASTISDWSESGRFEVLGPPAR
ncbi:hypothetical protein [Pseudomonas frederiksbergensis]|uniref:hypothetical protein n=1 Tax=Pseudomonas frederiksbergensis TaxID=104087 RepID=UPI002182524C|nr:hypothetical protein [Pseudomonas frederiksbergensis]